jgi:hypothetical protein
LPPANYVSRSKDLRRMTNRRYRLFLACECPNDIDQTIIEPQIFGGGVARVVEI